MSANDKSIEIDKLQTKISNLKKQLEIVNLQLASYQSMTLHHLQLKRQMALRLEKQNMDNQYYSPTCSICGNYLKMQVSTDETDCVMVMPNSIEKDYDEID